MRPAPLTGEYERCCRVGAGMKLQHSQEKAPRELRDADESKIF
jgi:hypothetical protein